MFGKKLLGLSFLSIIIGVACVSPLPFIMAEKVQTIPYDQPQFNIDLKYAFIGDYWNNDSVLANQSYGWIFSVVYQTSPTFNVETMPADAEFEYYNIELWSENGLVGNLTCATDARSTNFGYVIGQNSSVSSYFFNPDLWFEVNSSRIGSGLAGCQNGTAQGFITGYPKDLNQTVGKPETLSLTLRRIGWVVVEGNSTVAHLADSAPILQIQLKKYGEGFIYNNLFTEEQLSQINPVMPQYKLFALQGGHPVS
jgi:hypothetical protein